MKTILTIVTFVTSIYCFGQTRELDLTFREIQAQGTLNINSESCDSYLNKINNLIIEVDRSVEVSVDDKSSLKELKSKIEAFKEFVSTLAGCGSSGSQVTLKYFYSFINDLNLSPKLLSKKSCGEMYSLNIGSFNTFYVVNNGPGKTYSIKIETSSRRLTSSLGTLCKVARGVFQGKQIGKITRLEFTCKSITDDCWGE